MFVATAKENADVGISLTVNFTFETLLQFSSLNNLQLRTLVWLILTLWET